MRYHKPRKAFDLFYMAVGIVFGACLGLIMGLAVAILSILSFGVLPLFLVVWWFVWEDKRTNKRTGNSEEC